MPNLNIESQILNFDDLDPISQWALLSNGVVAYAKEIIRALELAEMITDANGIDAIIAATAAGEGVAGSTEVTKERGEAIRAMATWFLTQVATPLEAGGGLTPKQILYRAWKIPE